MNTGNEGASNVWWPNLFVLLFVGLGVLYSPDPMTTSRPKGGDFKSVPVSEGQRIEARLWQDPLAVVYSAQNSPDTFMPHRIEPVEIADPDSGKNTTKLPHLHGIPLQSLEAVESRHSRR